MSIKFLYNAKICNQNIINIIWLELPIKNKRNIRMNIFMRLDNTSILSYSSIITIVLFFIVFSIFNMYVINKCSEYNFKN